MTSLKKKILIAAVLPAMLFCLCFAGLPGATGIANAEIHLSNADNQKIENWCSQHLGNQASRLDKGACFEGYVLGLNNKSNSACDSAYRNHPSSIHACKATGYNAGKSNAANVNTGGNGGNGGNGGVAAGSADTCGGGGSNPSIGISISIGCKGQGNPIADMSFAVIRILSDGVGLVVVGSIIVGGIQYSASRGDPQATALAINRIRSSLFALIIFIFGYALLNYIIPGQFLQ
jgi:hypothetical protein